MSEPGVQHFVSSYIHCLSTTGGSKVPRPFGPSLFETAPSNLVQFDYINLGEGAEGDKYALLLRDDHSGYCWFFAFPSTNAENAAIVIQGWCAAFGAPGSLMSDGPTHFRNKTLRPLAKTLRIPHHFTLPYCPWSNRVVERLGKELLRVLRALVSEFHMLFSEWADLLPFMQSVINQSPSSQSNGIAPVTAFTGMTPTHPIISFYCKTTAETLAFSKINGERRRCITALLARCKDVRYTVQINLQRNRAHNLQSRSSGKLLYFHRGDYVLVAPPNTLRMRNLLLSGEAPGPY